MPVAGPPFAAVVSVATAGADSPLAAVAVVVEAALFDPPLADEPAEVAGALVLALDPVAAVEAVVPAVVPAAELG